MAEEVTWDASKTGDIHSSTGTPGAYDEIMPNFVPGEKFQDNALQTLGDALSVWT